MAAAGVIGSATWAEAATSISWPDYYDDAISAPTPVRHHKAGHHQNARGLGVKGAGAKGESAAKEPARPQGPVIVAISIERQSLKIYDANGLFAQTPVSTGMRGHSTPMGVFSVIQKQKFHRSNIYSGAPMPFMQRITWSGVAMHAGVLPGYPASHGCIRMPMAFAVKLWGWTKMGARVVVTPGEMTPSNFSHHLLAMQKPAATPLAAAGPQQQPSSAAKSDKAAVTARFMPETGAIAAEPIKREQAQTADASGALAQGAASATISDAAPSAAGPSAIDRSGSETLAALVVATEAPSSAADAKVVAAARDTARAGEKATDEKVTEKTAANSTDAPKPTEPKLAEKFDDKAAAAGTPATDLRKDQARPSNPETVVAKPDPAAAPKRAGQIAVFISRKDGKLYVRQNFAPLFEAPVTISTSDRPLGTHVFTAEADKDASQSFHWSVVTLPAARRADPGDDERVSRRRKTVGAVETRPTPLPDSPAEALDRIAIPQDAMARMIDLLSTGGSIIVSDQGISAGETGEGTDFIVSLR